MAIGLTNTLPRSSCGKCVRVLKELISGLYDEDGSNNNNNNNNNNNGNTTTTIGGNNQNKHEPPPLTLLRAIARSSKDHPNHDQWGQIRGGGGVAAAAAAVHHQQQQYPMLNIEETNDGVKLTIPVETTAPSLMKPWTHLEQQQQQQQLSQNSSSRSTTSGAVDGAYTKENDDGCDPFVPDDWIPLATSVVLKDGSHHHQRACEHPQSQQTTIATAAVVHNPLTIELKCRLCEQTGPEAGARAFLMGPKPLSIVLCHNRIDSKPNEIEEILTHELVHLYDVQTMKLDLSDCETVAYSEVRAAREAECCKKGERRRRRRTINQQQALAANGEDEEQEQEQDEQASGGTTTGGLVTQIAETLEKHVYKPYCVRNIALGATQNMFPSRGKSCLNKVWETAYGDHRPFRRTNQTQTTTTTTTTATNTKTTNTKTRHGVPTTTTQTAAAATKSSQHPPEVVRQQQQQQQQQEQPLRSKANSGTIHGTSGK